MRSAIEALTLKPHHFFDIIRDFGAGRQHDAHAYSHALHLAAARLRRDPRTPLRLTAGVDYICSPCSNLIDRCCTDRTDSPGRSVSKMAWNRLIDRRLFRHLGLREGELIRADQLCRLALERLGDIHELYPEEKQEKTVWRAENLQRGLRSFLGQRPDRKDQSGKSGGKVLVAEYCSQITRACSSSG